MYVIKNTIEYPLKEGGTRTLISYFQKVGMMGFTCWVHDVKDAQQYEFITEARRVFRKRFAHSSRYKLVKI